MHSATVQLQSANQASNRCWRSLHASSLSRDDTQNETICGVFDDTLDKGGINLFIPTQNFNNCSYKVVFTT